MRGRKAFRRLAVVVMLAAVVFAIMPAHAGSSALPADASNDVIDFLKHPQNSFRAGYPPYGSSGYQYQSPTPLQLDLRASSVSTVADATYASDGGGYLQFSMTLGAAVPARGSAVTNLPKPFGSLTYAWNFATTLQNAPQQVATECLSADVGPPLTGQASSSDRVYIAKVARHSTCPSAVIQGTFPTGGTSEPDGTGSGTRPADLEPVMIPPHFDTDGWLAAAEVDISPQPDGSKDFFGVLDCGAAPSCLAYNVLFGPFEGYSGFYSLEDALDAVNQSKFVLAGQGTSSLTLRVPYRPRLRPFVDDDMMLDDETVFPWPLGAPGATNKVTNLVAEVQAVAEVGLDTVAASFCPFGPDFFPEDPVVPPVGYPQSLPFADGGQDCIRGIFGLITILDWQDGGTELRVFPRSPAYTISADSLDCRYPIGNFPAPPVPLSIGSTDPVEIDASTSPFEEPWQVGLWTEQQAGTTQRAAQNVVALPNPVPAPIPVTGNRLATNTRCNYTPVFTGIHFFDILNPDVPM